MRAWAIKHKLGYLNGADEYDILTTAHLYLNKEGAEFELVSAAEQVVEVEIKEVENE